MEALSIKKDIKKKKLLLQSKDYRVWTIKALEPKKVMHLMCS